MNPDTREFLDEVACIAQANINYLHAQEPDEMSLDDQGSQVLMGAYLELYEQFMDGERSSEPSSLVYGAAEACCGMRRQLEQRPKSEWGDEEHGLFTLMLGYMFMFKHLYVVRA